MSSDKEYSRDYRLIYVKVVIVLKLITIILSVVSIGLLYLLNIKLKNVNDSQPVEYYSKL
jgi:hypothetical protein